MFGRTVRIRSGAVSDSLPPAADVSAVVLTTGNRPHDVRRAVESIRGQQGVSVEVVIVANGTDPAPFHDLADRVVAPAENAGIPGGRNDGAAAATAPVLLFLDDDARLVDDRALQRHLALFRENPRLGAVALRIVDEAGATSRRHIPRVGARDPGRSGPVTLFLGGAVLVRTAAFRDVGGYAAAFFYAMEESDLALRLADEAWEIHYDGLPAVFHPATEPSRHGDAAARTMRNRVWLAHRDLPVPLAILYVTNWMVISSLRHPRTAPTLLRAAVSGWRSRIGPRAPIGWRTVWRLTRLGRPPII